jgi:hypothetical protein
MADHATAFAAEGCVRSILERDPANEVHWYDGAVGPCIEGHVLTESVEYIDGAVVGRCSRCGDRVFLPTVPGGVSLVRIKALVEKLMAIKGSELPATARLANLSGMMDELSELVIAHAHENVKLGEAGKLLEIAKRLMRQLESAAE